MTTPQKIDSNITGLSYAEEETLGVLPGVDGADAIWRRMEPNNYGEFGSQIKTIPRAPINPNRQRKRGTVVDVDANAAFPHDFVRSGLLRLFQSFFFAAIREKADTAKINAVGIPFTAVSTTTYTAGGGLSIFKAKDITLSSGFTNTPNNGIKVLSAAAATSLTPTGGGMTVEASPPAAARVQTVGVQFASADVSIVAASDGVTLTSIVFDFATLDAIPGEWVCLDADDASNRFANNRGFARIGSIGTHAVVFDQTTWTPATEVGTAKLIRMWLGKVIKNEKGALIVRKSVQFERTLGNDGTDVQAEYVIGCVANELTVNVPQTDKITVDLGFLGLDGETRTGAEDIKVGTRIEPEDEGAFNTSSNIVRHRIAVLEPGVINTDALVGYVTESKLKVGNGIKPNKAVGTLGAFEMTASDFMVDGSVTAYFTTVDGVRAVRENSDAEYNLIAASDNNGFVFDMPLLGLGGGKITVSKDDPVTLPLDTMAAECALGYTLMYVSFPYLPDAAMPTV